MINELMNYDKLFLVVDLKMKAFTFVNQLSEYIDNISVSLDDDMKKDLNMLGDYIIDSVFDHEKGPTPSVEMFHDLPLNKIKKYNELVASVENEKRQIQEHKHEKKCFSQLLKLFQFMKDNNVPIGFALRIPYLSKKAIKTIDDLPFSIECSMNLTFYCIECIYRNCYVPNVYTSKEIDSVTPIPQLTIAPISLERLHAPDSYITHFTTNDYCLNRLRKLLIHLVKEEMELYSKEVDGEGVYQYELQSNKLLNKYCRNLLHECNEYLIKIKLDKPIPLKV